MASTSDTIKKRVDSFKWQDSYAGLVLGAIVVVVLGLLVANYFTKSRGQIGVGESITQEQQQTAAKTYKVAQGESLSMIANKTYGSYDYWPILARVNNISNPNLIYVDSEIQLPSKEEAEKLKTEMSATTYQVKEGDTLFIIAEKMYGDGSRWTKIDMANKVGRLPNGNPLIFAGSTLRIPR